MCADLCVVSPNFPFSICRACPDIPSFIPIFKVFTVLFGSDLCVYHSVANLRLDLPLSLVIRVFSTLTSVRSMHVKLGGEVHSQLYRSVFLSSSLSVISLFTFHFPKAHLFSPAARKLELDLLFSARRFSRRHQCLWLGNWKIESDKKQRAFTPLHTSSKWGESFPFFRVLGTCRLPHSLCC